LTILLTAALIVFPVAGAAAIQFAREARTVDGIAAATAVVTATGALTLAALTLAGEAHRLDDRLVVVDEAGAVFLVAIALVGLMSALLSPVYLEAGEKSLFPPSRARRWYYLAFFLFWATLLAVPVAGNVAAAWLLIEATTAASALLVAFGGTRSALEAGWKYLVLTTLGLTVALLGIVVLAVAAPGNGAQLAIADWANLEASLARVPAEPALAGLVLVLVGLAAKVGWAPVHNWLPDAHSEAPPPVSALLSAALLPAVVLVAWRAKTALDPAVGEAGQALFLGFGLASLAVSVPFLWRPLAWKRLLAYSSLEHMGVLALGIGFGHPLALAGVVLHVLGHALAKALGFYVAIPLVRMQPAAARRPPRAIARTSTPLAGATAISLVTLSGLPPSPLFVSELFILLGGALSGQLVVAAVATVLLALGFLGLAHALVEGLVGRPRRRIRRARGERSIGALGIGVAAALAALSALAYLLPDSALVEELVRWAG
jgi:hydrogenase-4 component F